MGADSGVRFTSEIEASNFSLIFTPNPVGAVFLLGCFSPNRTIGVNLGIFRAILVLLSLNCDFCDFSDFCDKISGGKSGSDYGVEGVN